MEHASGRSPNELAKSEDSPRAARGSGQIRVEHGGPFTGNPEAAQAKNYEIIMKLMTDFDLYDFAAWFGKRRITRVPRCSSLSIDGKQA